MRKSNKSVDNQKPKKETRKMVRHTVHSQMANGESMAVNDLPLLHSIARHLASYLSRRGTAFEVPSIKGSGRVQQEPRGEKNWHHLHSANH